jgi:hypothetical protein
LSQVSRVRHHPGQAQIHAIAVHRDTLLNEQPALLPSLCEAAVGTDDPMPWHVFVDRRQNAADETRRDGVDIAICPYETGGDRSHPRDYPLGARLAGGSVWFTRIARIGPAALAAHLHAAHRPDSI